MLSAVSVLPCLLWTEQRMSLISVDLCSARRCYSQSVCVCVCLSAETENTLLLFHPLIELGDFCYDDTPLACLPNVFDF